MVVRDNTDITSLLQLIKGAIQLDYIYTYLRTEYTEYYFHIWYI